MPRAVVSWGVYPLAESITVPWTPIDRSSGGPSLVLFSSCALTGKRLLALIIIKKGSRDKKAALAGRAEVTG